MLPVSHRPFNVMDVERSTFPGWITGSSQVYALDAPSSQWVNMNSTRMQMQAVTHKLISDNLWPFFDVTHTHAAISVHFNDHFAASARSLVRIKSSRGEPNPQGNRSTGHELPGNGIGHLNICWCCCRSHHHHQCNKRKAGRECSIGWQFELKTNWKWLTTTDLCKY